MTHLCLGMAFKEKFENVSMRKMLMTMFVCISILPIIIVGTSFFIVSSRNAMESDLSQNSADFERYVSGICELTDRVRHESIESSIEPSIIKYLSSPRGEAEVSDAQIRLILKHLLLRGNFSGSSQQFDPASALCVSDLKGNWVGSDETVVPLADTQAFIRSQKISAWGDPAVTEEGIILPYLRRIRNSAGELLGVCELQIKEIRVDALITEVKKSEDEIFVLCNANCTVLSSSQAEFPVEDMTGLLRKLGQQTAEEGNFEETINNTNYWCAFYHEKLNDLYFLRLIPKSSAFYRTNNILLVMGMCCVVCIVISVALSKFMSAYVTRPIRNMIDELHIQTDADASRSNELWLINDSYQELRDKLNHTVENYTLDQQRKKDAEMNSLIFQINPHYLYNALFSAICLIDEGENKNAINLLSALSDYFRIIISKGRVNIKVEEELTHVRKYLEIQQYRYPSVSFHMDVDPEIMQLLIPKIVLQPLVENAFVHGIKNMKRNAAVILSGSIDESGDLVFRVMDNGPGYTQEDMDALNAYLAHNIERSERKYGIGIRNVHERVQMSCGKNYGLSYARIGGLTVATLRLKRMEQF